MGSFEAGRDHYRHRPPHAVLANVIDNAVKHGRPGGGVFVGVDVADQRFTVDDDGQRIATADRERIFRTWRRTTTVANGSGIGLALVRLMLERASGRVEFKESPLGGARFCDNGAQG
jgi:signal transduction histidine kinase